MSIRALVFDFDGLILDTESPLIEAWASLHAEAGLTFDRTGAYGVVGHVDVPFDPWAAFPANHDRQALIREHRRRSRKHLEQQTILPGVIAYLDEAQRLGLALGVASNSDHSWVDGHLARLGLRDRFQVVRCRDDVARGKPEPDVYASAVQLLGVAPDEAVAFEDSVPGTVAAARAGLSCVAVPNVCTQHCEFSAAQLRLRSLSEVSLPELLQRLRAITGR